MPNRPMPNSASEAGSGTAVTPKLEPAGSDSRTSVLDWLKMAVLLLVSSAAISPREPLSAIRVWVESDSATS